MVYADTVEKKVKQELREEQVRKALEELSSEHREVIK